MTPDQLRIRILLSDAGQTQGLFFSDLLWCPFFHMHWARWARHNKGNAVGSALTSPLLYSVDERFLVRILTSGPRIYSGHPRRSMSCDHVIMTFLIGWVRQSTKNNSLHEVWYMECSVVCHRELY
jgi:hypothetical protein